MNVRWEGNSSELWQEGQVGPEVKVTGREVVPSPFKTRLGGRYLWILAISTP